MVNMNKEELKDYINLSNYVVHVDRPFFDFSLNMNTGIIEIVKKYPVKMIVTPDFDLTRYVGKNVKCITALFTIHVTNLRIKERLEKEEAERKNGKRIYFIEYDFVMTEENAISRVVNEVNTNIKIDFTKFQKE